MEKKTDYWMVAFSATVVGVIPTLTKQVKDLLSFSINQTILAALIGAIGALIGFGIYNLVKNKKTIYKVIAYIILIVILIGGTVLTTKLSSDSYVVKKEWNLISNGKLIFNYPNNFSEVKIDEAPENIEKMAYFSDNKEDRFAMNFIFDFKEEPPAPEESLSGAILNSLDNINATEIEWFDSQFYDNAITSKIKYKIENTERIGFGIIYFKDWHYELAIFLPYKKNYSDDFLNKVINSFSVEE